MDKFSDLLKIPVSDLKNKIADLRKESLNLRSKSGIHRLISALEERGFIKRLAHKARALEVIKLPETASANDIYNSFSPSVIKGGLDE